MDSLFLGLDVAQVNLGVTLLSQELKPYILTDTGYDFPEELHGSDVPDMLKNNFQVEWLNKNVLPYKEQIKMAILEGPNYSSSSNLTQISIGSIHGVLQQWCITNKINFGVLTPKAIYYAQFGQAKVVNKRNTINKMKDDLSVWLTQKEFKSFKIKNSNIGDSCSMAELAFYFYSVLQDPKYNLTSSQKEILVSRRLYKDKPKGLAHRLNDKFMYFSEDIDKVKENITKL